MERNREVNRSKGAFEMMLRLELDPARGHAEAVKACAKALRNPGSVALVPTETVYGLVCAWDDAAARDRIYALKRRSESKPLAAFLPDIEAASECVPSLPAAAIHMAKAFCPGPITIVVPDGKGATFGFRIPGHPFILALLESFGRPLASTSANLSGTPPALCIDNALSSLDGTPDTAIDGGPLPEDSLASTVVEVSGSGWRVLRPGPITAEAIAASLASMKS